MLRNFYQKLIPSWAFRCQRLKKLVGLIEQSIWYPNCQSCISIGTPENFPWILDLLSRVQSPDYLRAVNQSIIKRHFSLGCDFYSAKSIWMINLHWKKSLKIRQFQPQSCIGNSLQMMNTGKNLSGEVSSISSCVRAHRFFFFCLWFYFFNVLWQNHDRVLAPISQNTSPNLPPSVYLKKPSSPSKS